MRLEGPRFNADGPWFRGNLHSHTTESDGAATPAQVMDDYRRRGYDFLAISDHDHLTRVEPSEIPAGLTMIPALEAGVGPHILCVGIRKTFPKMSDRQAVIARTNDEEGIAVLNHPNWGRSFSHWDQGMLESLTDYTGIEIYNAVIEPLEGSPLATDRWDRLLTAGIRTWGFSNDDSHRPEGVGFGWIMVQADANTPEALLTAIREGRFYATTGASFTRIEVDGTHFMVESPDADRIRFIGRWGRVIGMADAVDGYFTFRHGNDVITTRFPPDGNGNGMSLSFPCNDEEGYVRCEAVGRGGRTAWTQPFWIV